MSIRLHYSGNGRAVGLSGVGVATRESSESRKSASIVEDGLAAISLKSLP